MHYYSLLEVLLQLVWALRGNEGQDLEHQWKRWVSCPLQRKKPKHAQNRTAGEQWLCGKCRAEWCKAVREGSKAGWETWLQHSGKGRKGRWITPVILTSSLLWECCFSCKEGKGFWNKATGLSHQDGVTKSGGWRTGWSGHKENIQVKDFTEVTFLCVYWITGLLTLQDHGNTLLLIHLKRSKGNWIICKDFK